METPKRRRLSKYEFAVLFLEQKGLCGCGCGLKLEAGQIDEEHSIALAAGGQNPKPDSLWRRDCHRKKTKNDRKAIKKINHVTGKTGRNKIGRKKKKIQSKGFDKSLSKSLSGIVRKRIKREK